MYTLLNFAFIAKLNQKTVYGFSVALNYRLGGGGLRGGGNQKVSAGSHIVSQRQRRGPLTLFYLFGGSILTLQ